MPEYLGPESFARDLADLKRRLLVLETSPQSNNVSLLDGLFTFRTASNENVKALMGTDAEGNDIGFWAFADDGGTTAVRAYVGTGTDGLDGLVSARNRDNRLILYALSSLGCFRPAVPVPWTKNPAVLEDSFGNAQTASASYDTLYRSYLNSQTHIYHRWSITLGGGVTSVAFKLTGQDTIGGGVETTIYEQTGITGATNIEQVTAMPSLMADGNAVPGALLEVRAYLRITGGAGNATLGPIWPAMPWTT